MRVNFEKNTAPPPHTHTHYPPKMRRRGKYACIAQAKNIRMVSGRFLPLPLHNQSNECN